MSSAFDKWVTAELARLKKEGRKAGDPLPLLYRRETEVRK